MFRVTGDRVDVFPAHLEDIAWRVSFFGDEIEEIKNLTLLLENFFKNFEEVKIFANSHYITPKPRIRKSDTRNKKRFKGSFGRI